jgi:hypothetical protein
MQELKFVKSTYTVSADKMEVEAYNGQQALEQGRCPS